MKVKDLIEKLKKFDQNTEVAACLDSNSFKVFDVTSVAETPIRCRRNANGDVAIDDSGTEAVFINLDES